MWITNKLSSSVGFSLKVIRSVLGNGAARKGAAPAVAVVPTSIVLPSLAAALPARTAPEVRARTAAGAAKETRRDRAPSPVFDQGLADYDDDDVGDDDENRQDEAEEAEDQEIDREPDEDVRQRRRSEARRNRWARACSAERARCAAIFSAPAAAKNLDLAAELAFHSDLSARAAAGVLRHAPARAAAVAACWDDVMTGVQNGYAVAPDETAARSPVATVRSWDEVLRHFPNAFPGGERDAQRSGGR